MSMFSEAVGKIKKEAGGYLADRTGYDGGPPNIPMPNIPAPGKRNFFNVFMEGVTDNLNLLTHPDAGIPLLSKNLEYTYKNVLNAVNNPGKAYDESWGGGNWMNRLGIGRGGDDDSGSSSSSASSGSGDGGGDGDTNLTLNDAEEERARLDAIRRMLAGRYGRAETNLTGGAGYGSGSGRSIGGYSG